MKKIIQILSLSLISIVIWAQGSFSYQSIVRNSSGTPQANIDVYLKFSVLETSSTGTLLYSETQIVRTDAYGWLNTNVGTGTQVTGNFNTINWSSGAKYLKVECAESPTGNYSEIATSQINNSIFAGPRGPEGPQGPVGAVGPQGPQGATGPQGPAGTGVRIVGSVSSSNSLNQNYQGQVGDMFIAADTGIGYVWNGSSWVNVGNIQGPQGPQGPQGIAGPQGIQGSAGPTGPQGATGATGPQGATGAQGPQGPAGPPNSLSIGSVTSGAQPAVTITGQSPNQILNFVLQQGPQGANGATGPQGATGATGATGPQGPQGPVGPQGPQGPAGSYTAGTGISISGGTISANNSSSIWNANQLVGYPISSTAPQQGYVLKYFPNNTPQWEPAPDATGYWEGEPQGISYQGVYVKNQRIDFGTSSGSPYISNSGGLRLEGTSNSYATLNNGGEFRINAYVHPTSTGAFDIGNLYSRWSTVFTVNGVNQSSDERLKKNIIKLNAGLDKILKMNPVSYQWKSGNDGRTHIGFIAQELEKIAPEVVSTPSDTSEQSSDNYGIYYSEIIPILVKAIQEQNELIKSLEAKIERLEGK